MGFRKVFVISAAIIGLLAAVPGLAFSQPKPVRPFLPEKFGNRELKDFLKASVVSCYQGDHVLANIHTYLKGDVKAAILVHTVFEKVFIFLDTEEIFQERSSGWVRLSTTEFGKLVQRMKSDALIIARCMEISAWR